MAMDAARLQAEIARSKDPRRAAAFQSKLNGMQPQAAPGSAFNWQPGPAPQGGMPPGLDPVAWGAASPDAQQTYLQGWQERQNKMRDIDPGFQMSETPPQGGFGFGPGMGPDAGGLLGKFGPGDLGRFFGGQAPQGGMGQALGGQQTGLGRAAAPGQQPPSYQRVSPGVYRSSTGQTVRSAHAPGQLAPQKPQSPLIGALQGVPRGGASWGTIPTLPTRGSLPGGLGGLANLIGKSF